MRRAPHYLYLTVAAILLGISGAGGAAVRCGADLVTEGDSVVKLLEACGEPTVGDRALYLDTAEWTYNLGPEEFMVRISIRDGRVERIEELGYGISRPAEEDLDEALN